MKINSIQDFIPIAITIETKEELHTLYKCLSINQDTFNNIIQDYAPLANFNTLIKMNRAIEIYTDE